MQAIERIPIEAFPRAIVVVPTKQNERQHGIVDFLGIEVHKLPRGQAFNGDFAAVACLAF